MEPHAGFNILDFIVLGIILLSGLLAILSGFVREMYSLFNWAASYFIAVRFYPALTPHLTKYISHQSTADDAAIFIIFCISFIVLSLIGIFLTNFIKGSALTAIDRSLGFVFGLVRGVLIVCIIYLVAASVLWPELDKGAMTSTATAVLPDEVQNADNPPEKIEKSDKDKPQLVMLAPKWLVEARTRPMLARGASMLKEFIPAKALERTTDIILKQKEAAKSRALKEMETYSGDKPVVQSNENSESTNGVSP